MIPSGWNYNGVDGDTDYLLTDELPQVSYMAQTQHRPQKNKTKF